MSIVHLQSPSGSGTLTACGTYAYADEIISTVTPKLNCTACMKEIETMSSTPGVKHDADKPQWAYLPWDAVEEVVKVLDHGAQKYSRDNWRLVADSQTGEARYLSAALRHIKAHRCGETVDPESGLLHLAHAVTSLLFLIEAKR